MEFFKMIKRMYCKYLATRFLFLLRELKIVLYELLAYVETLTNIMRRSELIQCTTFFLCFWKGKT